MRANNVKKIWRSGGNVVNAWCAIPTGFAAEALSQENFDSVTVDMQHGIVDYTRGVELLQAISTTNKTPLARVSWNEPGQIMKILDAGAYGIVCPMINNKEECEKFVGACRYYPTGYRSFGPARAAIYGGPDYYAKADSTILTFAMIETREALDKLDEIMSVKALDAIYVGPSDLAISLGVPPAGVPSNKTVISAIDDILKVAQKHKKVAGIHCGSGAMAAAMYKKGFRFCTLMNDVRLMSLGAKAEIAAARGGK